MKTLTFKKISIRNFMSFGDDPVVLDFTNGLNLITGYNHDIPDRKNGIGKCLHPKTEIIIRIDDETVLESFKKFIENSSTSTKYLYEEEKS